MPGHGGDQHLRLARPPPHHRKQDHFCAPSASATPRMGAASPRIAWPHDHGSANHHHPRRCRHRGHHADADDHGMARSGLRRRVILPGRGQVDRTAPSTPPVTLGRRAASAPTPGGRARHDQVARGEVVVKRKVGDDFGDRPGPCPRSPSPAASPCSPPDGCAGRRAGNPAPGSGRCAPPRPRALAQIPWLHRLGLGLKVAPRQVQSRAIAPDRRAGLSGRHAEGWAPMATTRLIRVDAGRWCPADRASESPPCCTACSDFS